MSREHGAVLRAGGSEMVAGEAHDGEGHDGDAQDACAGRQDRLEASRARRRRSRRAKAKPDRSAAMVDPTLVGEVRGAFVALGRPAVAPADHR